MLSVSRNSSSHGGITGITPVTRAVCRGAPAGANSRDAIQLHIGSRPVASPALAFRRASKIDEARPTVMYDNTMRRGAMHEI